MYLKWLLLALIVSAYYTSCNLPPPPPPATDSLLKLPPPFTLKDVEPNFRTSLYLLSGPRLILGLPLYRVNTELFPLQRKERDFGGKTISVFGGFEIHFEDLSFADQLSCETRRLIDDYLQRGTVFVVSCLWLSFRDDKLVEITVDFKFSPVISSDEEVQFVQDLRQTIITHYGPDLVFYDDFGQDTSSDGQHACEGRLWLVDEANDNRNNILLSWGKGRILQFSILAGSYDDSSIRQYQREHRGAG